MKSLKFATHILKHIPKFSDLKCDGTAVVCCICNIRMISSNVGHWKGHLKSVRHQRNKKNEILYATFLCEFIVMCCACNIPLNILNKIEFRQFWKKYVPNWDLPSNATARRRLKALKQTVRDKIKNILHNKKVWIAVDETTDVRGYHVTNVLARVLDPGGSTVPYLLASKRLQTVNAESIQELVTQTLLTMDMRCSDVLMLVTDPAQYMVKAGQLLKQIYPNLLHVTCLVHALHLVVEEIRRHYPDVDGLIVHTKEIFVEAPKCVNSFHNMCPNNECPPPPILIGWEMWIKAVGYYHNYFQQVKGFILQLNPNDSKAISEAHRYFNNPEVEAELHTIYTNYTIVEDSIRTLQNSSLSLEESLNVIHSVQIHLQSLNDGPSLLVSKLCDNILQNNVGYTQLCSISRVLHENSSVSDLDNFKFANITSVDVEKSFSSYASVFTPQRRKFLETNLEAVLLVLHFTHAQSQCSDSVHNL